MPLASRYRIDAQCVHSRSQFFRKTRVHESVSLQIGSMFFFNLLSCVSVEFSYCNNCSDSIVAHLDHSDSFEGVADYLHTKVLLSSLRDVVKMTLADHF